LSVNVLIIEDDDRLADRLAEAFRDRGLTARVAYDAPTALVLAHERAPDRVVLDLRLPGINGLELLPSLLRIAPDAAVVVLTGYGAIPTAVAAVRLGAVTMLQKPANADEILAAFDGSGGVALSSPSLARSEWEHIQRVLADCDGNVSEAARRLGLHRRTLQRKRQKYPPKG